MSTFLDYLTTTLEHDQIIALASQGADGGFPGLTYTGDCELLYHDHMEEIWDALEMDAMDLGYDSVAKFIAHVVPRSNGIVDNDTLRERLVWYMVEREAQRYADACREDV